MDEREHLPVRSLRQHRRRDPGSQGQNQIARMNPFTYSRADDERQALADLASRPGAKFLGGGTNLMDLMKMGVETPAQLIDINRLPLEKIEDLPTGGVRIGALVRNSD